MRKILLSGGAGFVGSHVFEKLVSAYPDAEIVVLDRMTYAADYNNIAHLLDRTKRTLVVGTITDLSLCHRLTNKVDCVVHVAAESHVDNSFGNFLEFTMSNTAGTHTLLEAARLNGVPLFIHVSTDEVYGEVLQGDAKEDDRLAPTNPYSASKASAEMIVHSYMHSYGMAIITVRANNIFGIRQYPVKIIAKFTMQALLGLPMRFHGTGMNKSKVSGGGRFRAGPASADAERQGGRNLQCGDGRRIREQGRRRTDPRKKSTPCGMRRSNASTTVRSMTSATRSTPAKFRNSDAHKTNTYMTRWIKSSVGTARKRTGTPICLSDFLQ